MQLHALREHWLLSEVLISVYIMNVLTTKDSCMIFKKCSYVNIPSFTSVLLLLLYNAHQEAKNQLVILIFKILPFSVQSSRFKNELFKLSVKRS